MMKKNNLLSDINSPSVVSIAGTSHSYRTTFLIDNLINNLEDGKVCIFYTMDMSLKDILLKIYSRYTKINFSDLKDEKTKKIFIEKINNFKIRFENKFFVHSFAKDDLLCISMDKINTYIESLKKDKNIIVNDVFIDDIEQMMSISNKDILALKNNNVRTFISSQLRSDSRNKNIRDLNYKDFLIIKNISVFDNIYFLHNENLRYENQIYGFPFANLKTGYFGPTQLIDTIIK